MSQTNPYIGPRTFQRNEGHLFYGREREARDLIALVASERLVVFYAQSGAGKSSIVNTRLIPNLESKEYEVLPVGRLSGDLTASEGVDNVYVHNLIRSMEQHDTDPKTFASLTLFDFLAHLNYDDQGFFYDPTPVEADPASDPTNVARRALIIDQFEELFSTYPESWEQREKFFEQLAKAMEDDPQLWVVLVMREDYIAALDPYAHIVSNGLRVRYYMQRLGREAALKAVKSPVEGLRPYAEGVAEKLIDDLCSIKVQKPDGTLDVQPGQYAEPVQMQVVCYGLWDNLPDEGTQISEKDLQDVGDVNQSLGKYYDKRVGEVAMAKNVRERLIREWFEKKLITAGGIRNMVLQERETKPGELHDDVIQALQSDLVRGEKRGGATWYELTHDRLVEPVLERNKIWFAEHLSPLQRQAAFWKEQNQQESWLLRDHALVEMEIWAGTHKDELTETEEAFLEACRKLQKEIEEKRAAARKQLEMANKLAEEQANSAKQQALANLRISKQLRISTIISGFASLLLVASILLGIQSYQNQRKTQMQVLVNASVIEAEKNPNLAALLAYQALQNYGQDFGEVEEALANILYNRKDRISSQSPFAIPNKYLGVSAIVFDPASGNQILAAGYTDGNIFLVDVPSRTAIGKPLTEHIARITSLAFNPDGTMLASSSLDGNVILWDVKDRTAPSKTDILSGHSDAVNAIAFSPDGKTIASGGDDNTIVLWDVTTQQEIEKLAGHTAKVTSLVFSPDGKKLASGSYDTSIILWDVSDSTSPKQITTLLGHTDWVNTIAFSPDGNTLASGGDTNDRTIILWDVSTGDRIGDPLIGDPLTGTSDNVSSLAFSPDGSMLVSSGRGFSFITTFWDLTTSPPSSLSLSQENSNSYTDSTTVAFSPDGKTIATGSNSQQTISLWDVNAQPMDAIPALGSTSAIVVDFMFFNTDGDILAISPEHDFWLWNANMDVPQIIDTPNFGAENPEYHLESFNGSYVDMWASALSPDGVYKVEYGTVTEVATGQIVFEVANYSNGPVAFSPDGRYVASASDDNIVRIWEANNGKEVARLDFEKGDYIRATSLAFSPDGSRIVVAFNNDESTVEIWDISSEQKILIIENHQQGNLGYAVVSSKLSLGGSQGQQDAAGESQNVQIGNPVADLRYSQDGLYILYENGFIDQWDIWPSRVELAEIAKERCGSCDLLTPIQRAEYGLYTWPMRVQDYAGYLITLFNILLYGFCILKIRRTVFRKSVKEIEKHGFSWKKFLSASTQGMVILLISIISWGLISFFEQVYYFPSGEVRFPSETILWLLLLTLPLAMWSGGVYSHFTRLQASKWPRTKRSLLGTLAGFLGGSFAGFFGIIAFFYLIERDFSSIASDIGTVIIGSLILGIATGIMSLFGALLYIFLLEPWASGNLSREAINHWLRISGVRGVSVAFIGAGLGFLAQYIEQGYIDSSNDLPATILISLILGLFGFMFYPHRSSYILTTIFGAIGTIIWYPYYSSLPIALWFGLGSGFVLSAISSRILLALKKI